MTTIESTLEETIDTLTECWEYFDDKADCDFGGDPGEYIPNKEMNLLSSVQEAIKLLTYELKKLNQPV